VGDFHGTVIVVARRGCGHRVGLTEFVQVACKRVIDGFG
jgi:hypothetical protein